MVKIIIQLATKYFVTKLPQLIIQSSEGGEVIGNLKFIIITNDISITVHIDIKSSIHACAGLYEYIIRVEFEIVIGLLDLQIQVIIICLYVLLSGFFR
ncbi:hypothetical protein D3C81_1643760 [compost metagenome]